MGTGRKLLIIIPFWGTFLEAPRIIRLPARSTLLTLNLHLIAFACVFAHFLKCEWICHPLFSTSVYWSFYVFYVYAIKIVVSPPMHWRKCIWPVRMTWGIRVYKAASLLPFIFWFFYDTSWDQSHSRWWHHLSLSTYHLRCCYNSIVTFSQHLAGIKETPLVRFRLVDRSGSSRTVADLPQPTALRSVLAEQLLQHSNFPWRLLHVYWTWQPASEPPVSCCIARVPRDLDDWYVRQFAGQLAGPSLLRSHPCGPMMPDLASSFRTVCLPSLYGWEMTASSFSSSFLIFLCGSLFYCPDYSLFCLPISWAISPSESHIGFWLD